MLIPIIDRNRCDGKQDCVAVCPFDVFAMQRLTALDLAMFSVLRGKRTNSSANGRPSPFAPKPATPAIYASLRARKMRFAWFAELRKNRSLKPQTVL